MTASIFYGCKKQWIRVTDYYIKVLSDSLINNYYRFVKVYKLTEDVGTKN